MKEYTITERLVPVYSTWELRGARTRVQRMRTSKVGPKAGARGTVIASTDRRTVMVNFDEPVRGANPMEPYNCHWACRIDTLNRVDVNNLTEVTP